MRQRIRSSIWTLTLISFLIFLVIFNINSFISGPLNVQNYQDRQILNLMLDKYLYLKGEIVSRYSYEEVYYVAKVEIEAADYLVWYDLNSSVIYKALYETYDEATILHQAQNQHVLEDPKIVLGIYKNEPIYLVYDQHIELRYSYLTKELLSIYYKEVRL